MHGLAVIKRSAGISAGGILKQESEEDSVLASLPFLHRSAKAMEEAGIKTRQRSECQEQMVMK